MGFENGSVGFRMYDLPSGLPRDHVERFARHALPPLDSLGREAINGWVTGRHLLDRRVTEDSCRPAGYLRLTLAKAERKIPEALLRAECAMEELAELQASGMEVVPRARRTEIRRSVVDRLLPAMPPTLTGIPWVLDEEAGVLYAAATSDKQSDAFVIAFRHTVGVAPIPVTPEVAALKRSGRNARDLLPTSFTEDLDDALAGDNLGMDFLTWLWFYSEARGGTLDTEAGEIAVAVEGPLTFVMEGDGAHVAVLRKGAPQLSAEARTSLVSGKKLARARITLARGETSWSLNLDAPTFVMRGVKLPKEDGLDSISRFQGRMLMLRALRDALFAFFDTFTAERFDARAWVATRDDMRRWARDRAGRM